MVNLNTWDETDKALARLGEVQAKIQKARDALNAKTAELERKYAEETGALLAETEELKAAIGGFALDRQKDFEGRTMTLGSGIIKLRTSTLLDIPNTRLTIQRLKDAGMEDAVKVSESVKKSVLTDLSNTVLAQLGIKRRVCTSVNIQPNQG